MTSAVNKYIKRRFHYFRAVPGQFYFFEARRTQFSDTLRAIAFALCSFCGTNAAILTEVYFKIFFDGRTFDPFSPLPLFRLLLARKIGMSLLFPRFLPVRFSAMSGKNKIRTYESFSLITPLFALPTPQFNGYFNFFSSLHRADQPKPARLRKEENAKRKPLRPLKTH